MNAIIALCHFCELHGPKILFCTQPFHPQEPDNGTDSYEASGSDGSSLSNKMKSLTHSTSTGEPQTPTSLTFKNDLCEGCYSIRTGFISHDNDAPVSYVSSQHPHHREVFSMIRQACLRSLSGEVCPGREGPIFFGNDQQGHVLSYTFYIKDSQARGFQRGYSILVVMMDKIYLLNSWPFLVPHLKIVVEHLQNKASKVYEDEQTKCPQRAFRLTSSINPGNFMQQRGGNKPARSLMELTDDKNIFKILHVSFVWILKACGNRITETLLEGPPTEDSIIDMEKQEETEEGFIKLFSKRVNTDTETEASQHSEDEIEDIDMNDVDGQHTVQNLRHLMKILGEDKFHILAHHVTIGNQVIVKGSQKATVKSVLNALKSLLPKGCCRVVSYSRSYEESWRCNFLGLHPDISLPSHVLSSEMFVLVEIIPPEDSDDVFIPLHAADELKRYHFKMASPVKLPDKVIKVKVLFKFTKAGGGRSEEDTKKLLLVAGAQEEDKQLLKFWMTGLSVQYRTHILSTSKSQH
ncbi:hypothetical protein KUTeg_003680 [Tegillarca granosa]|uniref:Folliculin n=1 Tax=Tegillarca granosa TaxID=220873 RepID=A0ABQ9FMR8_TEGGR|nr:hypothetical protein KUTeg_003680 [Tegillarca granosa]